jgi:2-polyprenyl-3-methyl-5-hydroxy-6-metoxy-1,4-benzoquinol methylase
VAAGTLDELTLSMCQACDRTFKEKVIKSYKENRRQGPERSVLDYGCGQGDDVRALQAGGIPVTGWDPHYAPNAAVKPAQNC